MATRNKQVSSVLVTKTVSESSFSSGVDGWVATSNATLSNVYGNIRATVTALNAGMQKTFSTEAGKTYRIMFKVNLRGWPYMYVKDVASTTNLISITDFMTPGDYSYIFTATGFETNVIFHEAGNASGSVQICNFTLEEVEAENGYRFGFNGKELDPEGMGGGGSTYDYGFRIYNAQLGKFLSVDPLTGEYPWWTPYQFAGNRPIDGIDLDGLEFLDADEARVEYKYGRLQLKVENFWLVGNFVSKNLNPAKWKQGDIGYNPTIASIQFNIKTQAQATDIPGEQLPNAWKPQTENNRSRNYGKKGTPGNLSIPPGNKTKAMAKGVAAMEAIIFVSEQVAYFQDLYDNDLITEHTELAEKAFENVKTELSIENGLIDKKYQNKESLTNIMNVVLQGVNNTDDKEIYNIGIKIYNKYNPKATTPTSSPVPNPAGSTTPTDNTYQVPPPSAVSIKKP